MGHEAMAQQMEIQKNDKDDKINDSIESKEEIQENDKNDKSNDVIESKEEDSILYPIIINDKTGIQMKILDKECLLIRNVQNTVEQIKIFKDILKRDKSPKNAPKAMYPSPKTLIFGDDKPTFDFKFDDESLYNQMINKANDIIDRNYSQMGAELKKKYKSVIL